MPTFSTAGAIYLSFYANKFKEANKILRCPDNPRNTVKSEVTVHFKKTEECSENIILQ